MDTKTLRAELQTDGRTDEGHSHNPFCFAAGDLYLAISNTAKQANRSLRSRRGSFYVIVN